MSKIIAIVGPTGVGKTSLSIKLAKALNAEIINCDAMQIYKELNIGTAKITNDEMDNVKHHMLSIKSIEEEYSIYDYQKEARKILENLIKEDKNIIIVGGSGLYLKALLYDYKFYEEDKKDYSNLSLEELIKKIKSYQEDIDIDYNNRRRVERTLEKLENNIKITNDKSLKLYDVKIIALKRSRDKLYEVINDRVEDMFRKGLLEEASSILKYKDTRIFKTAIGYKELIPYFNGEISLDLAKEKIKTLSRRYAKRQLTFFKHQIDATWYDVDLVSIDTIVDIYKD